jgi:hypothetical protein
MLQGLAGDSRFRARFVVLVLYGSQNTTSRNRRYRQSGEWTLDEPDCTQFTDAVDGFFIGKRYLIQRSALYKRLSRHTGFGIESVKLSPRSPTLNAYAERFVRTTKEGCLEQMIFFGEDSLRKRDPRIASLPSGTKPSRTRQLHHHVPN